MKKTIIASILLSLLVGCSTAPKKEIKNNFENFDIARTINQDNLYVINFDKVKTSSPLYKEIESIQSKHSILATKDKKLSAKFIPTNEIEKILKNTDTKKRNEMFQTLNNNGMEISQKVLTEKEYIKSIKKIKLMNGTETTDIDYDVLKYGKTYSLQIKNNIVTLKYDNKDLLEITEVDYGEGLIAELPTITNSNINLSFEVKNNTSLVIIQKKDTTTPFHTVDTLLNNKEKHGDVEITIFNFTFDEAIKKAKQKATEIKPVETVSNTSKQDVKPLITDADIQDTAKETLKKQ